MLICEVKQIFIIQREGCYTLGFGFIIIRILCWTYKQLKIKHIEYFYSV